MENISNVKYGLLKPAHDAHTMGLLACAQLLEDCGYQVVIGDDLIADALSDYEHRIDVVIDWIKQENITNLGLSYRLDEQFACSMITSLYESCKSDNLLACDGGRLENIFYAGLFGSCNMINEKFGDNIITFSGGESPKEMLLSLGVPQSKIAVDIISENKYDEDLLAFGKKIIDKAEYLDIEPNATPNYKNFGTKKDTIVERLAYTPKENLPLMRAHVGPYSETKTREECVQDFASWVEELSKTGYLDIVSMGTSQLTQQYFGEDWTGLANGGGVPINTQLEFEYIYEKSRPLLIRTYSSTSNVKTMAELYEKSINICWHALSFWWFNVLDCRGTNDLLTSLKEHFEAISYIAKTGKAFEANVSHHFSFRGGDDITYIVSLYLTCKAAKLLGIKTFIMQNMLNTPRITYGIQDVAKSRAALSILKTLEDEDFQIILQPRAGLDYFKSDLYEAKCQLAAVSAMMCDLSDDFDVPSIVHVVSYSEAKHLSTPEIINESVQITRQAMKDYVNLKKSGGIKNISKDASMIERKEKLIKDAWKMISAIEENVQNLYTPQGFYDVFVSGFFICPHIWNKSDEIKHTKDFNTKFENGGIVTVDNQGQRINVDDIIKNALKNLNKLK